MPMPIITVAQMREWEAATWAAGRKQAEVIRRVGFATAQHVLFWSKPNDSILILAGKGNNGNDARAASAHLPERYCELIEVTSPADALAELETALKERVDLIIDGLFGIGLNRPLDAAWIQFIQRVNQSGVPVLSVDVPSGLSADTGEPQGAAIEAAVTVTVAAPKIGMLKASAWPHVGRLELAAEVGFVPCPFKSELQWSLPGDFAHFPPRRPIAGNKGDFGHLAVVAGSKGYHGASVLATHGAQRAQPGLVTLFTQENVYAPVAAQLQAAMAGIWSPSIDLAKDYSAVLIGPGLASPDVPGEIKETVRKLWSAAPVPVIVDASALAWVPPGPVPKDAIRVVTPHPGEAGRMLKWETREVQADRPRALRELSQRFGNCWVVLKGHQTLSGRNADEIFVNGTGNPHLAQGGSGDTLGGFIAGWLAQGAVRRDPGLALRYAVWEHGAAADRLQSRQKNWVVEDLVAELGHRPA